MKALLCLGRLLKLEVVQGDRVGTLNLKGKWLAWNGRNLLICTVKRQISCPLPSSVSSKHRKFHGAEPAGKPFLGECPSVVGKLKQCGLIKSLVYVVPRKIKSPEKNPHHWHHAFGDTGHKGGDSYPEKVMPALMKDARGNLFFKRRKGNIYSVDQWIRG